MFFSKFWEKRVQFSWLAWLTEATRILNAKGEAFSKYTVAVSFREWGGFIYQYSLILTLEQVFVMYFRSRDSCIRMCYKMD